MVLFWSGVHLAVDETRELEVWCSSVVLSAAQPELPNCEFSQ